MRLRDAEKLRAKDVVILKVSGEIFKVVGIFFESPDLKTCFVELEDELGKFTVKHDEITHLQVSDIVVPKDKNRFLHCGSGCYPHAIVGRLPFNPNPCLQGAGREEIGAKKTSIILVSEEADMVWSSTWEADELKVIGRASNKVMEVVNKRLSHDGLI